MSSFSRKNIRKKHFFAGDEKDNKSAFKSQKFADAHGKIWV